MWLECWYSIESLLYCSFVHIHQVGSSQLMSSSVSSFLLLSVICTQLNISRQEMSWRPNVCERLSWQCLGDFLWKVTADYLYGSEYLRCFRYLPLLFRSSFFGFLMSVFCLCRYLDVGSVKYAWLFNVNLIKSVKRQSRDYGWSVRRPAIFTIIFRLSIIRTMFICRG